MNKNELNIEAIEESMKDNEISETKFQRICRNNRNA